jgi:predicted CXXCH cytochrome family protein
MKQPMTDPAREGLVTGAVARSAAIRAARGVVYIAVIAPALLLVWLAAGATPAGADGGPHVAIVNSGADTLTADGCAGCHRAHTAQGPMLLAHSEEEALCLSCHGSAGMGATTDVETGVQYALGVAGIRGGTAAGALRSGGFVEARIDSANLTRISFPRIQGSAVVTTFSSRVGVLAASEPVTSAHLAVPSSGVTESGTAWGNGVEDSGPGPTADLGCASCHNPHGNGQYRILNPIPGDGDGPLVEAGVEASVTDAALPSGAGAAGVRNYTIQDGLTLRDVLDASLGPTAGDYWRRYLPWDGVPTWNGSVIVPATGVAGDRPMYVPGSATNLIAFRSQISAWCSACHTRYDAPNSGATTPSGDDSYAYRHTTQRTECTQCHVAHGSNAGMAGTASSAAPYPDGTPSGSSRLLKVDNRGTCQQCHDPTGTIPYTGVINP